MGSARGNAVGVAKLDRGCRVEYWNKKQPPTVVYTSKDNSMRQLYSFANREKSPKSLLVHWTKSKSFFGYQMANASFTQLQEASAIATDYFSGI